MSNTINNRKGFSLVELMIVVAIIGILAAVSAPAYFKHILRSRQLEGNHRLLDIKTAQEKYYALNDTYYGPIGDLAAATADFRGMVNFDVTDTSIYLFSIPAGTLTESFLARVENDLNEDGTRKDCWTITNLQTEPLPDTTTNNCTADGEKLSFSLMPF